MSITDTTLDRAETDLADEKLSVSAAFSQVLWGQVSRSDFLTSIYSGLAAEAAAKIAVMKAQLVQDGKDYLMWHGQIPGDAVGTYMV